MIRPIGSSVLIDRLRGRTGRLRKELEVLNQHVAALVGERMPAASLEMKFEDNRHASTLFGDLERNLKTLEKRLKIRIDSRGSHLMLKGDSQAIGCAHRILELLYARIEQGDDIQDIDIHSALQADRIPASERRPMARLGTRKTTIEARNPAQDGYLKALGRNELVFGVGPAGTGKTYLAVAHAAALLSRGDVARIILSRPAVEAGEKLGFLPGDLKDKVDPYLRPLYDALYDMMDAEHVERCLASGVIEVAPLAFMRGRTLSDAVVILDEAQNTTSSQMKMFLTRLGHNARMIVTGDPTQIDLPSGQVSGLAEAVAMLDGIEGVEICRFADGDVVRHPLVGRIVRAYEAEH